ncbi:transposase [Streptomyces sp. NPDC018000]|uniref:transposase n=1 Tax=Streptomyces sp. NPDC018000 TaxID=3365028 RepID=UPI0037BA0676
MAAPRKYSLELRERAVRMYRTSDPKPQIKKLAVELGVHPEALRGWIRRRLQDAGRRRLAAGQSRRPRSRQNRIGNAAARRAACALSRVRHSNAWLW